MKVAEMKVWAKEHNLRCPQLRKKKLIGFLAGKMAEKETHGERTEKTSNAMKERMIAVSRICTMEDYREHLEKHGWVVVPLPGWKKRFVLDFLEWFASCNDKFDPKDESTWKTKNLPILLHGILKNYFGQTELQWRIRELCVPIFEDIWQIEGKDLLCSFDGGCFMPPRGANRGESWFHNDEPRDCVAFDCVQGAVNFVDNGPEDGGFVCVEKSHTVHSSYMQRHPGDGYTWEKADMNDPDLKDRRVIKVCAPAGHIILFDSRLFHCNIAPTRDNFRMCIYVSMQPRSGAEQSILDKRIKAYETGRMSTHWCYGPYFSINPERPRSYGNIEKDLRPKEIEIAKLNPLRRRLIGYD